MALVKDFERRLNELWHRRTANVRSLVKTHRGRPKGFTRKHRERGIREVQDIAERILGRQGARDELDAVTAYQRRRQIRGRGLDARFSCIMEWAQDQLCGPIIYSFWRGKRCLYVGKGNSWRRLGAYRRSIYLVQATTVRVRGITSPSHLAKAECLSVHLFNPRDNSVKASKPKYAKVCPVCHARLAIRDELRTLFRLR